jgi:hypothetical protein
MGALADHLLRRSDGSPRSRRKTRIIILSAATAGVSLLVVLVLVASDTPPDSSGHHHGHSRSRVPSSSTPTTLAVPPTTTQGTPYPVGTAESAEPSGLAPPGAEVLAGYRQTYVSDFKGSRLPTGWGAYAGKPGSDPGAQWGLAHVVVSNGMLQLNTYQDAAYGGEWVTGGVSQYGHSQTYGAYFVRSRVTGPGPTNVELLWPVAPEWPPEIDFNETGGATIGTSATVHWGPGNNQDQRSDETVTMTQWHTWGVIWTPTSITYTVDGVVFGTVNVPSEIPNQAMTLDLQQQTWCSSGFACPTSPQSMDIDWVAEYAPS